MSNSNQDKTISMLRQLIISLTFAIFACAASVTITVTSTASGFTTFVTGSTEITINDEIITITNPTTLTVTDECTIDYITTVDDQSSLIINQQSSSVPILQSGNTHNTSTNVTVIEANGANRLLTNAVIAAAAGVAIVVMM